MDGAHVSIGHKTQLNRNGDKEQRQKKEDEEEKWERNPKQQYKTDFSGFHTNHDIKERTPTFYITQSSRSLILREFQHLRVQEKHGNKFRQT